MLTWHIVKKDLRRHRGALMVFATLLALKWVIGLHMISGDEAPRKNIAEFFELLQVILIALDVVVAALLVGWLIHEDPVVGTDALWLTRPLRPIQMLAAKATGIFVVLGVVPVGVTLPWWWFNGLTGSQILHAAGEVFVINAGIALFTLPFAVLTRTTRQFIISVVGIVAGWQIIISLIRDVVRESSVSDLLTLTADRVVLFLALFGLISLTIFLHQYITRRTTRSVVLSLAGFVLASTLPLLISRDLTPPNLQTTPSVEAVKDSSITLERVERRTRRTPIYLRLVFTTKGSPPGYALHWLGFGQQTLDWADGRQDASSVYMLDQSPTAEGVAALLASNKEADSKRGIEQRFTTFLRIATSAAPLLANEVPRYTLQGTFNLVEPRLIATGPAVAGTSLHRDGHTARVVQSATKGRVLEILTVETSPWRLQPALLWASAIQGTLTSHPRLQLFLAGPTHRIVDSTPSSSDINHTRQRIAGVHVLWRRTEFILSDDPPPPGEPSPSNGVTLGALYASPVLTMSRTVTIDGLPVPRD